MKKLFLILLAAAFLFSTAIIGFGIYKYGSVNGIVRRVQFEIASRRPKDPVVIPTFVPEATVDTAAFVANLATETVVPTEKPTLTPIPTITPSPTELDSEVVEAEQTAEPSPEPTATTPILLSPTPTITPTPIYTPAAQFVNLTGYTHNWQEWNNCGPATLATYLSFLGKRVTQFDTAEILKPNESDKNVRVDEIVSYVESRFPDLVVTPILNGSPETMRILLSNGFSGDVTDLA